MRSNLRLQHPRMHACRYAWSLPVMWKLYNAGKGQWRSSSNDRHGTKRPLASASEIEPGMWWLREHQL